MNIGSSTPGLLMHCCSYAMGRRPRPPRCGAANSGPGVTERRPAHRARPGQAATAAAGGAAPGIPASAPDPNHARGVPRRGRIPDGAGESGAAGRPRPHAAGPARLSQPEQGGPGQATRSRPAGRGGQPGLASLYWPARAGRPACRLSLLGSPASTARAGPACPAVTVPWRAAHRTGAITAGQEAGAGGAASRRPGRAEVSGSATTGTITEKAAATQDVSRRLAYPLTLLQGVQQEL